MMDTAHLQVTVDESAGAPIVAARGDVDLCTTVFLREALEQACSGGKDRSLVAVDMRDVAFIDSAGLALLVEMRKRFIDRCQIALIIAPGSQPERVLKLGRFDSFLRVAYTPEEALGAL